MENTPTNVLSSHRHHPASYPGWAAYPAPSAHPQMPHQSQSAFFLPPSTPTAATATTHQWNVPSQYPYHHPASHSNPSKVAHGLITNPHHSHHPSAVAFSTNPVIGEPPSQLNGHHHQIPHHHSHTHIPSFSLFNLDRPEPGIYQFISASGFV